MNAKLKKCIEEKNTRLCFSADFTRSSDLIKWIHKVGKHICILKTHIDILDDFNETLIETLIQLKKKYNFLILEDRKFSDICKTFHKQVYCEMYSIYKWADIITIHGITCKGILDYINLDVKKYPHVLIVAEMSSKDIY